MRCNSANGRVHFGDGWLIKYCFVTNEEMKASQLTRKFQIYIFYEKPSCFVAFYVFFSVFLPLKRAVPIQFPMSGLKRKVGNPPSLPPPPWGYFDEELCEWVRERKREREKEREKKNTWGFYGVVRQA